MRPIPNSVREHISNAEYYLEAAEKHPVPTRNAVYILLLLTGWENIALADAELGAWAKKDDVDKKMYKSHASKHKKTPEIRRIILGPRGTKPKVVSYSTGRDFEKLRMACQFGSNTESVEVKEIFKSGWHLDGLRNKLIGEIKWIRILTGAYEILERRKDTNRVP